MKSGADSIAYSGLASPVAVEPDLCCPCQGDGRLLRTVPLILAITVWSAHPKRRL